jgi:hypothetical protein
MFPFAARSQQTEHVAPIKSGWCLFFLPSQASDNTFQGRKRRGEN